MVPLGSYQLLMPLRDIQLIELGEYPGVTREALEKIGVEDIDAIVSKMDFHLSIDYC